MSEGGRKALITEQDVYAATPLQRDDIEEAIQDGSLTVYGTSSGQRLFAVEEIRSLVQELYEEGDDQVPEDDNPSGFESEDFEI